MTYAFCRACGNGVAADARFCASCGAPGYQAATTPAASPSANMTYTSYADVPWFRRRWFAVVCFLVFSPALLFLLATGDIYREQNGQVCPIGKTAKYVLMGFGALAIVRVLIAIFS
jgi:hypothetical protein